MQADAMQHGQEDFAIHIVVLGHENAGSAVTPPQQGCSARLVTGHGRRQHAAAPLQSGNDA
jgi:hypothetical protein